MSELQMALIGAGALLVAAVWGYNLWQDKQHRRRAERMLPAKDAGDPDVLMAGREAAAPRAEPGRPAAPVVHREPTFSSDPAPRHAAPAPSVVPVPQAPPSSAAAPDAPDMSDTSASATPLPAEWGDGHADCLLRIEFVEPVSVSALWAEHSIWSRQLDKPVQWLGMDARGRWRTLSPQEPGAVAQVAAALQLANRLGAVGEATLTTFLQGVHKLAQAFSGLIELPEPARVLAQARDLDAFCAGVDVQLGLYVLPRQGSLTPLGGDRLLALCEQEGLRIEGERFVAFDAAGAEAFALTWQSADPIPAAALGSAGLSGLALSLDVPRTAAGAVAFERMAAMARKCADALGAQLVDAHQQPLAEAKLTAIRDRIEELQRQMAARDIPAGSVRALRLFS